MYVHCTSMSANLNCTYIVRTVPAGLERLEVMVGARQRSANWPKPIVDALVSACNKKYDIIDSKFSMSVTSKRKNDAWHRCHGREQVRNQYCCMDIDVFAL